MSGYIEIIYKNKNRQLLNVRHIEEVAEKITKDGCYIYLAFNAPNAIDQDYFDVAESYDSIIEKIAEATVLNAYAQVQNF